MFFYRYQVCLYTSSFPNTSSASSTKSHPHDEELSPKSIPRKPIGGSLKEDSAKGKDKEKDRKAKADGEALVVGEPQSSTEKRGTSPGVSRKPVGGGSAGDKDKSGGKKGK